MSIPEDLKQWRKAQREALIARRLAIPETERHDANERLTAALVDAFTPPAEAVAGFCWPFKNELDARFAVRHWREGGAYGALPEVAAPRTPLTFRLWKPGVAMRAGVYDIPVPDGTPVVLPDIAIVPMNGFDGRGFRLGYGGAFFDRTLAALERRIVAIGIAFEALRMETIHPQPHDIPMDFVVTESAIYAASGEPLEAIAASEAKKRFERLLLAKRLPRAAFPDTGLSSPVCYADQFPDYFG